MNIQLEIFPTIVALIVLISTLLLVRNLMELATILLKLSGSLAKSVNHLTSNIDLFLDFYKAKREIEHK